MSKYNTGQKGMPMPNRCPTGMPGHGKVVSSGKLYMVNSVGRTVTAAGKTGASNMGRGKHGNTSS